MRKVREGEEKVIEQFTHQSQSQRRQKRQQQHNSQQTTLSEFEARELIKRARSIIEGY